jgi:hypothetical protein
MALANFILIVRSLLVLGYEEGMAKKALACNPSVETAVDWIESHRDELESAAIELEKGSETLKVQSAGGNVVEKSAGQSTNALLVTTKKVDGEYFV